MDSKVIAYAIEAHQSTNHLYDDKPYSVHLVMVASYAQKYIEKIPFEHRDDVINACWLHDTIEDTRKNYYDIFNISNKTVADIVYAVTNEKGKNRRERANDKYYRGIAEQSFAVFVKLCDRLANVKYSKDMNSDKFEMYRNENKSFLKSLIYNHNLESDYDDMISELNSYLK